MTPGSARYELSGELSTIISIVIPFCGRSRPSVLYMRDHGSRMWPCKAISPSVYLGLEQSAYGDQLIARTWRTHARTCAIGWRISHFYGDLQHVVTQREINVETRDKDGSPALRVAHLPMYVAYAVVVARVRVRTDSSNLQCFQTYDSKLTLATYRARFDIMSYFVFSYPANLSFYFGVKKEYRVERTYLNNYLLRA